MEARSPGEILEFTVHLGAAKTARPPQSQLILGFLAGAFIAFGAQGSNMAAFNLLANPETYGLGRVLAGAVFGVGLMLVLAAGGELFTGNCLILTGVLEKRVKAGRMLQNWLLVYAGNLAGGVFIAFLMSRSGLFAAGENLLGGITLKIAAGKTALPFSQAVILGLLCNWLVCLAVWVSFAAQDAAGKMLACFFVVGLFVTSGFEHCIANMYYIPAGIFAKGNSAFVAASGAAQTAVDNLTWLSFITKNLIPVTLGNILGGAGFTAFLYWRALSPQTKK